MRIRRWEAAWLGLLAVGMLAAAAVGVLPCLDEWRRNTAWRDAIMAAFENPACKVLLNAPADRLLDDRALTRYDAACTPIVAVRRALHANAEPSTLSAAFINERWTPRWSCVAQCADCGLDALLLVLAFMPVLYGLGLVMRRTVPDRPPARP